MVRNLLKGMEGEYVKFLHDELDRLGYRIPQDERIKKYFGYRYNLPANIVVDTHLSQAHSGHYFNSVASIRYYRVTNIKGRMNYA